MYLIMVCGQGDTGKSTFCKYLQSINPNIIHISVDKIVHNSKLSNFKRDIHFPLYIEQIKNSIKNAKENDIILLDFSQDCPESRKEILQEIPSEFFNKINFLTISLRPGINNIIKWNEKRHGHKLNEIERIKKINVYNNFVYPTLEEFEDYSFHSIINISLNNGKINLIESDDIMQSALKIMKSCQIIVKE